MPYDFFYLNGSTSQQTPEQMSSQRTIVQELVSDDWISELPRWNGYGIDRDACSTDNRYGYGSGRSEATWRKTSSSPQQPL